MAEAGHEEATLSEEAQRFWLARTALRGYLTARSELDWRVRNLYNKTDAFTKAVEGLGGVGDFQSCADECAYSFACARGGDALRALGSSIGWTSSMEKPGESSRARTRGPRSCVYIPRLPSEDALLRPVRAARS